MKNLLLLLSALLLGCTGVPDNVSVVQGFELQRYLGTWYEIARLDHSFERGLSNVSATYTLRDDGGVKVINKGFNKQAGQWEVEEGKAYFVANPEVGRLKVSFFGPFYGAYNIIALDKENYSYSMVCGPNRDYLWILSRSPDMKKARLEQLVSLARKLKFPTDELIYVEHDQAPKNKLQ
jgi:apolipoprotein D and lipocalin family protein